MWFSAWTAWSHFLSKKWFFCLFVCLFFFVFNSAQSSFCFSISSFKVHTASKCLHSVSTLSLLAVVYWAKTCVKGQRRLYLMTVPAKTWCVWQRRVLPQTSTSSAPDCLVGRVVRCLPRERKIPGSKPACAGIFSGSTHTSDLKIGTPVATLPGAWRYRVNTGTGWPVVSILWLGEVESVICNFYLSVAARTIVWADPSLRYTRLLLGC